MARSREAVGRAAVSPRARRRRLGDRLTALVYDPILGQQWSYAFEQEVLAVAGVDLMVPARPDEAVDACRMADVIYVMYPVFGVAEMARLERCVGLVTYGVGMDAVDLAAAARAHLPVANVPDYCTDEVSDHALALLLAAERRLLPLANAAARGDWTVYDWPEHRAIRRLRGQTLGVVGTGRIGRQVAAKARAFGFRTVGFDPHLGATGDPELPLVGLDELLCNSDAIVLCAALTESSRRILDDAAFVRMRPGVIVVNVARGALIDEGALLRALRAERVAVAALDVRDPEPPGADDAIRHLPNVILTQHYAATSEEAWRDLHLGAAEAGLRLLTDAGRLDGKAVERAIAPWRAGARIR